MEEALENNVPYREPLRRPVIQRINIPKEEVKYRIKWWVGGAMITLAVVADIAELIITWIGAIKIGGIISMILSIVLGFVFQVWLLILGVPGIGSPKQFFTKISVWIAEIVPFIDAIPLLSWGWTIGAIAIVVMVRAEDKNVALGAMAQKIQVVRGKFAPKKS